MCTFFDGHTQHGAERKSRILPSVSNGMSIGSLTVLGAAYFVHHSDERRPTLQHSDDNHGHRRCGVELRRSLTSQAAAAVELNAMGDPAPVCEPGYIPMT